METCQGEINVLVSKKSIPMRYPMEGGPRERTGTHRKKSYPQKPIRVHKNPGI